MIGGWITHVNNRVFIGFGPHIECSHCHNTGWLEIWQPYFQQWAYSVIPAHPKMWGDFTVMCKICHWGIKIKKKDKAKVAELLEQGKTSTKYGFDRMDAKGRDRLLKKSQSQRVRGAFSVSIFWRSNSLGVEKYALKHLNSI